MNEDLYVLGRPAPREKLPLPHRLRRLAILLVAGGTIYLLMGWGEAIYAAPVLVPALWWAHRNTANRIGRAGLAFLAGLVMLEVGWALTYVTIGERQPYILADGLITFVATIAFFMFWHRGRHRKAPDMNRPRDRRPASPVG